MMNTPVDDYSDLGKPISFAYLGITYTIPPIPPAKAKKLIKMSREIGEKSKKNEMLVKSFEDRGEALPDSLMDEMSNIFDFQMDFIITAGLMKVTYQDGVSGSFTTEAVNKAFIDENWSTQLVMKIFQRINEVIVGEQEKKS